MNFRNILKFEFSVWFPHYQSYSPGLYFFSLTCSPCCCLLLPAVKLQIKPSCLPFHERRQAPKLHLHSYPPTKRSRWNTYIVHDYVLYWMVWFWVSVQQIKHVLPDDQEGVSNKKKICSSTWILWSICFGGQLLQGLAVSYPSAFSQGCSIEHYLHGLQTVCQNESDKQ